MKVANISVLPASAAAGSRGSCGLGIEASVAKEKNDIYMYMVVKNATRGALSQFAVQFNKNSFGLAPKTSAMSISELTPGESARVKIPLEANKLNSGSPPSEPQLSLQVAVRTNIDIFYFVVPFDLHVVLDRSKATGIVTESNFSASWEALKSSEKEVAVKKGFSKDQTVARMQQGGFKFVGDFNSSSKKNLVFSALTANKLLLLVQMDASSGRCAVRASNVHVVSHGCVLVGILFGGQL